MAESPTPAAEFDYIIVDGGSAGRVLAARPTEDPDVTVCLVEAGPSDVGLDAILALPEKCADLLK